MGKLFWVGVLYFAEGFPYGFINEAFPVYFRFQGISLQDIGLLSLVGLPWTFKVFWAPLVDTFFERKHWIVFCNLFLAVFTLLLALNPNPSQAGPLFWSLLVGMAVLSATQDIAIDAYTIEFLDEKEMGPANGIRVTLYRVALIVSGGVLVACAGLIGWRGAMIGASALLALAALVVSRVPYRTVEHKKTSSPVAEAVLTPLKQFWLRPGFFAVLVFILLFKVGDYALAPMTKPFWVDRQFTPFQIGLVPGTVGIVSTIAGALLGGKCTERWGIFNALWILGLFQAVSNLVYAGVAALPSSNALMYTAVITEAFCGGLGTASFLAFLMSACDKAHAATQYALLSALVGFGRSIAGAFSGYAAHRWGYGSYFAATFFLALPAFALLPWVKQWQKPKTV